jgi:hypothetical protein
VFLRAFFFPCGVNVDRHVLHGTLSGGAVRQSTCGTLEDVPVPRKTSSTGSRMVLTVKLKDGNAIRIRRLGLEAYEFMNARKPQSKSLTVCWTSKAARPLPQMCNQ